MLRRWAIRVSVFGASFFLLASWFRVFSRRGDGKPKAPPPTYKNLEDSIDEPKASGRGRPARIVKSVAGVIGALATLVFAYLAVAVSAHWFPWENKTSSIVLDLNSRQSYKEWHFTINMLTNFLSSNYTHVTHLNLDLTNFVSAESDSYAMSDLVRKVQSTDILYKRASSGAETITAIYLGTNCGNLSNVDCTILILNLGAGPGSNLGYVTQNAAGTISIFGYYQVGAVACQTGTCKIDLIPVEPPT
jgi:hypothetical protein